MIVGDVLYCVHTLLINTTAPARPKAHIRVHSVLWMSMPEYCSCPDLRVDSFTSHSPSNAIHRSPVLGTQAWKRLFSLNTRSHYTSSQNTACIASMSNVDADVLRTRKQATRLAEITALETFTPFPLPYSPPAPYGISQPAEMAFRLRVVTNNFRVKRTDGRLEGKA